jgi:hypothetical protein
MCAKNARLSTEKGVARELWKMAQEYQAEAAELDNGRRPVASMTMRQHKF